MKTRNADGAILIISLWTLAILCILAAGVGFRLSIEARLSKHFLDRLRAEYAAKAGVFRAADLLIEDEKPSDSLAECGVTLKASQDLDTLFVNVPLADAMFTVAYKQGDRRFRGMGDEDSKININKAGKDVLRALFEHIGKLDSSDADELAFNVIDWRDEDHAKQTQNGAEDYYYESLSPPYPCADKDFKVVEELLLVKEMTPELFGKIKDLVTVHGDDTPIRVNINTAPVPVLEVLGQSLLMGDDSSHALADAIDRARNGVDGLAATADDHVFENDGELGQLAEVLQSPAVSSNTQLQNFRNFFKTQSSYYRIESKGEITGSKTAASVTAVVKKDKAGEPTFVYYHVD